VAANAIGVGAADAIYFDSTNGELTYWKTGELAAEPVATLDVYDAPLIALLTGLAENDTVTFNTGEVTAIVKTSADAKDITGAEDLFAATLSVTGGDGLTFGAAQTNLTIVSGIVTTGDIDGDVAVTAGTVETGTISGTLAITAGTVTTGAVTGAFTTGAVNTITGTTPAADALVVAAGVISGGTIGGTDIAISNVTDNVDATAIGHLFATGAATVTLTGSVPELAGVSIGDGKTLTIGTGVTAGLATSSLTIAEGGTLTLDNQALASDSGITILAAGIYGAVGGDVTLSSVGLLTIEAGATLTNTGAITTSGSTTLAAGSYKAVVADVPLAGGGVLTIGSTLESIGAGITATVASVGDTAIETTLVKVTKGTVHVSDAATFDVVFTPVPASGATVEYIFDTSLVPGVAALGVTDKTFTFGTGTATLPAGTKLTAVNGGGTTLTLATDHSVGEALTITEGASIDVGANTLTIAAGGAVTVGNASIWSYFTGTGTVKVVGAGKLKNSGAHGGINYDTGPANNDYTVETSGTDNNIEYDIATATTTLNGAVAVGTGANYYDGTIRLSKVVVSASDGILTVPNEAAVSFVELTVGDTTTNAVKLTNAKITTIADQSSTGSEGDALITGSTGTVLFRPDAGGGSSDTGSLVLAASGVLTTYGTGNVAFGSQLILQNTVTTNGYVGIFTASSDGPITITQTDASNATLVGAGTATGSKLTLGSGSDAGVPAIDLAATSIKLTVTDAEVDITAGALKLIDSGATLDLTVDGDGDTATTTHSVAKLTINGTSKWIASALGSTADAAATSNGFAQASSESSENNIMAVGATNEESTATGATTIVTGIATPSGNGNDTSAGAPLTVADGTVTIAGGTASVISSASLLLIDND
jgi:hypothetical protein